MGVHDHMAGADAVRFFLNGFPRLRTSAEFRESFREEAAIEIERLINALDVIDGDTDFEDGADDEAFLAGHSACGNDDREADTDSHEGEDDEDREPDRDREHELGWLNEGSQANLGEATDREEDNDTGLGDEEALEDEVEAECFATHMRAAETPDQRDIRRDLSRIAVDRHRRRRLRRDPDTVKIIRPGVAVFGDWF